MQTQSNHFPPEFIIISNIIIKKGKGTCNARKLHINTSVLMNYIAYLNTSHVSPHLNLTPCGLPCLKSQRGLCKKESLNKLSKHILLNMNEPRKPRRIYCQLLTVVIHLSELRTGRRGGLDYYHVLIGCIWSTSHILRTEDKSALLFQTDSGLIQPCCLEKRPQHYFQL